MQANGTFTVTTPTTRNGCRQNLIYFPHSLIWALFTFISTDVSTIDQSLQAVTLTHNTTQYRLRISIIIIIGVFGGFPYISKNLYIINTIHTYSTKLPCFVCTHGQSIYFLWYGSSNLITNLAGSLHMLILVLFCCQ